MIGVALLLIMVPLLDHAIKLLIRLRLASGSLSLGALGEVRLREGDIWLARGSHRLSLSAMWVLWITAALSLAIVGPWLAWPGWVSGLLLGGSLSHAVERSLRGSICDYVCLRFWPAFDLADAALAICVGGIVVQLAAAAVGGAG